MLIGFSASHARALEEQYLAWTVKELTPFKPWRFEVCTSGATIERLFTYDRLRELNAGRDYQPETVAGLRRVFAQAKAAGMETALWTHELWFPDALLTRFPDIRSARGDVQVGHPRLTDYLADKYTQLFAALPELDALTLTMTETKVPVMRRFDCALKPALAVHWLVRTLHDVCRAGGRKLIVRPFSAIRADMRIVQKALALLPGDIEIMVKCDPFDWDPFLGLNPEVQQYPPGRLTVEFDLGSEYFGRGLVPAIYPDYLAERLALVQGFRVPRVIGRVDRASASALDREGRVNVAVFARFGATRWAITPLRVSRTVNEQVAQITSAARPAEVARLWREAFSVICHTLYVDGQLLFHRLFGDLAQAQDNVLFETLRPSQPLDHCADEWHILAQKQTPTVAAARAEKATAVAQAERIARRLATLAPDQPEMLARAHNLVHLARLYQAAVIAMQDYLAAVVPPGDPAAFTASCDRLDAVIAALPATSLEEVPTVARTFAAELRAVFALERAVYRDLPGLTAEERGRVLDVVAVGYPGEGHRLCKYTHGAAVRGNADRRWRTIRQFLGYTLRARPGPVRLCLSAAGTGRLTVHAGRQVLARADWSRETDWGREELAFVVPGDQVDLRVERVAGPAPGLGPLYLLAET